MEMSNLHTKMKQDSSTYLSSIDTGTNNQKIKKLIFANCKQIVSVCTQPTVVDSGLDWVGVLLMYYI